MLALVVDRESLGRIIDAFRGHAAITFCETRDDLLARAKQGNSSAVILSARDRTGASTIPCVSALRESEPARPVIAYCDVAVHDEREIEEIVRAGAGLAFRGRGDSPAMLRARIERGLQESARDTVLRCLRPDLAPAARGIVDYCVKHARNNLTVGDVAAALGVHRRTLTHRLARAGYPSPRDTITRCCLLVAAVLLEDRSRSVEYIANELEYPCPTAFRNTLKRHTGLRPTEVRERGGLACVRSVLAPWVRTRPSRRATVTARVSPVTFASSTKRLAHGVTPVSRGVTAPQARGT